MKREEFLKNKNNIFLKIGQIKSEIGSGRASIKQENDLDILYKERNVLYADFMRENKPCNSGDMFTTESAGGRKIKGVADDFFIRDGVVYIESYYPIINGNKKSQIAYFSVPHKELKVIS